MNQYFFDAVPLAELKIRAEREQLDVTRSGEQFVRLATTVRFSFEARVRDEFSVRAQELVRLAFVGERATVLSGTVALFAILNDMVRLSSSSRTPLSLVVRGDLDQDSPELRAAFSSGSLVHEIRSCPLWLVVGKASQRALEVLSSFPSDLSSQQLERAANQAQCVARETISLESALRFALNMPSRGAPKPTSEEAETGPERFRSPIAIGRFLALQKKGDT